MSHAERVYVTRFERRQDYDEERHQIVSLHRCIIRDGRWHHLFTGDWMLSAEEAEEQARETTRSWQAEEARDAAEAEEDRQ